MTQNGRELSWDKQIGMHQSQFIKLPPLIMEYFLCLSLIRQGEYGERDRVFRVLEVVHVS